MFTIKLNEKVKTGLVYAGVFVVSTLFVFIALVKGIPGAPL